jgi:SsrA-binding protein
MEAATRTDSMTVVPTKAYFSNGKVKVELALARGKRDYDKREDLKKKADQRAIQSYLR